MTELGTHSKFKIANVSRRDLLKGVAATGGLVLVAQFPGVEGAFADYPTGATAMPNGVVNNPKVFVSIAGDGRVTHRCRPCRDGQRRRAYGACR